MKKVLILCNSSGGLYDFRNELVLELLKEHKVYVSAPDEVATDKLRAEGCEVIHTDINRRGMNPVQDLGLFKSYWKLLKEIKPDVVLTYTIKPNIYGGFCCRLQKVPYIVNITGLGTTFERGGMLKKMVVCMYKAALKKANCVFFQNDRNKQIFEENGIYGKKAKRVNGSGVNVEKYEPEEYPGNEKPKFLFVGRLMKEKGIEEYLSCAKKYANRAEFDIIGYCEEAYEDEVNQLQQQGMLRFHGFQSNVKSFYKEASFWGHQQKIADIRDEALYRKARDLLFSSTPIFYLQHQDGLNRRYRGGVYCSPQPHCLLCSAETAQLRCSE